MELSNANITGFDAAAIAMNRKSNTSLNGTKAMSKEEARAAAQDFEAFFLSKMAETMFEGISTDGMFGGQEIMGVVSGMVFVMCAIAVIMLIVDLIAGLMGLSRSRRPEKYGFFLGWGIPLLVIGVLGTLMGGIFTPPALVGIVCGVVAPILFIVGGVQQNRLHNQNTSPRF